LQSNNEPIALPIGGVIMEDRWFSVDEIAAHLGIKRDTVYRWINRYGMPAHRIGRLWKFKKNQVDKWVESGGAQTSSSNDSEEQK